MKFIVLWAPVSPLLSHQPCNLSSSSGALEGMGFKSYSKVDSGYTCPRKKGNPLKTFLKGVILENMDSLQGLICPRHGQHARNQHKSISTCCFERTRLPINWGSYSLASTRVLLILRAQ